MTIQTVSNKYGVAKWIVDPVLGRGTHQTITAAYAASSAGDTIAVRPATYTEDPPVKPGTNLVAFNGDQFNPNVTIVGTCTMTGAGTSSISNICLQTNSAAAVAVTGSAASILNLNNCFLNFTNNTGITLSSSSSSSAIIVRNCRGNLGTTGIGYFALSGGGILYFNGCDLVNSGLSTTASTISSGLIYAAYTRFLAPITTSSTGIIQTEYASIQTAALNVSALTHNSTAASCVLNNSYLNSGTASAITLGTGSALVILSPTIASGNTNAITETGAATLSYNVINFQQAGTNVNVTTINPLAIGPKIYVGGTCPGQTALVQASNGANSASSASSFNAAVGGTSAGDAWSQWTIGSATAFSLGVDNSDSDRLKLTTAAAATVDPSSGTTLINILPSGEINHPLQPAFLGFLGTNVDNVTGTGTAFQLGTTTALTEVFDQNSDFNTNGTFTAPVTGRYQLCGAVALTGCTINTAAIIRLVSSNRSYQNGPVRAAANTNNNSTISVLADMDAADTCVAQVLGFGEAGDTDDLQGSSTLVTFFSGFLAC